jgi:hypothetical protein
MNGGRERGSSVLNPTRRTALAAVGAVFLSGCVNNVVRNLQLFAMPTPGPTPTAVPQLPTPEPLAVDLASMGRDAVDQQTGRAIFSRLYFEVSGDVMDPSLRITYLPGDEFVRRYGEGIAGVNIGQRDVVLHEGYPLYLMMSVLGHEILGHNYHRRMFAEYEARETDATLSETKGYAGKVSLIRYLDERYQVGWYRALDTGENRASIARSLNSLETLANRSGVETGKWHARAEISLWNEVTRNADFRAVIENNLWLTGKAAWDLNLSLGQRLGRRYWDENGFWRSDERGFIESILARRLQPQSTPANQRGFVSTFFSEFRLP